MKFLGPHINIILPVVLYGSETWLLTLREQCRLRVFQKKMLRKIIWSNKDEAIGERRRQHNEELNDLCASPNIIRVIKQEEWDVQAM